MPTTKSDEDRNFSILLQDLLNRTSAHGLPNVGRSESFIRRLFWASMFICGLGMFIWQSSSLIAIYYSREVDVSIDIKYSKHTAFPAVTICNFNPIKLSKVNDNEKLQQLLSDSSADKNGNSSSDGVSEAMPSGTGMPPTVAINPKVSTTNPPVPAGPPTKPNSGKRRRRRDGKSKYGDWDDDDVDFNNEDEKVVFSAEVYDVVTEMTYSDRDFYGHQITDMLLSCQFNGFQCSPRNFTHLYNYLYGNCYSFNSGRGVDSSIKHTSKSGPLHGLVLELNLEQYEYIPAVQPSVGIRVVIHDNYLMPFPEDDGIAVSPGFETFIGVRKLDISRKPEPYGDCVQLNSHSALDNLFYEYFGTGYSLSVCDKNCLFMHIARKCNCADSRYRYTDILPPCKSTNESQTECKDTVYRKYLQDELTCICSEPCKEVMYDLTATLSYWPSDQYEVTVMADLIQVSDNIKHLVEGDSNFVRKNVAKVDVYYEQLNYESITQTPSYDWFSLISDLGGQIGLWMGVSMITIFEFLEFIYDLAVVIHHKATSFGRKKNRSAIAPRTVDDE